MKRIPDVQEHYWESVDFVRAVLVILGALSVLGLPTENGSYWQRAFGFAPYAFYMLSGYLILGSGAISQERIRRTTLKSGILFVLAFAVYFVLNRLFYQPLGLDNLPALSNARFWLETLVLGRWPFPIGGTVWYIEAYFFAYLVLLLLNKTKGINGDGIIAVILLTAGIVTGELAKVVGFSLPGVSYIPSNFLTGALPYLLLGRFVRRCEKTLCRRSAAFYWIMALLGVALTVGEYYLLVQYDAVTSPTHLAGMALTAFAVCVLTVRHRDPLFAHPPFSYMGVGIIYYLHQPLGVALAFLLVRVVGAERFEVLSDYLGIVTVLITLLVAVCADVIRVAVHGGGVVEEAPPEMPPLGNEDPD